MLPEHRQGQGREAFKRIMCFDGIPKEFENEKMIKSGKSLPNKYITLKELSEKL